MIDFSDPATLVGLVLSLLFTAIVWGVNIATLVVAIIKWEHTRSMIKPGLIIGGALVLLGLPVQILSIIHLDVQQVAPGVPSGLLESSLAVGFGCSFFFVILGALHKITLLSVGSLARPEGEARRAFPLLLGAEGGRTDGLWQGAVVGVITGVVSVVAFLVLDVKVNPVLEQAMQWMPGLDVGSTAYLLGAVLPAVIAAAIGEELIFRGVIQAWLTRWLGGTIGAVVAAIGISSLIWAIGHALNADPIWIKLLQILLIGFAFGALSRKYSVESAICAHVCLNVVAVIGGVLLG